MHQSLRVLLIEDSEEDAELIELSLKRGGLDVVVSQRVETRAAMLEALDNKEWDILLVDYSMPQFSLDEALAIMREKRLDIPVLIVSATIVEDAAIRAMRDGARDFIMKNSLGRLAPAVARELREAELRCERRNLEEHVRQNQKMESLGVLAGGVAHDFNNLLVGIMGNAGLVMDMVPESSPLTPLLEDVVLASQKAADLTRQMLAYAGKGRFISEPTNLSTLVQDISGLVRTSIPRNVRIDLDLASNLPPIEADPTQIQQLVMNLLINGAEAIGNQQGIVTVRTGLSQTAPGPATHYFVAQGIQDGQYVFLQVTDTGCGMDDGTRLRIFEPFFTTKFTGRGLGLSAAMGIVRGHKGALKVASEPGKGSTFEILFPALTGKTAVNRTVPLEPAVPRMPAPVGHILVVDDEDVVRRTAKSALERHGYTVLLSDDGRRAVNIFSGLSDQIALVLLDLTMPVMGGEEALDHLRALRNGVPILLTSGYDEWQVMQNFPASGEIAGFLQKPYTGATLVQKVDAILGRRAAAV